MQAQPLRECSHWYGASLRAQTPLGLTWFSVVKARQHALAACASGTGMDILKLKPIETLGLQYSFESRMLVIAAAPGTCRVCLRTVHTCFIPALFIAGAAWRQACICSCIADCNPFRLYPNIIHLAYMKLDQSSPSAFALQERVEG